MTHGLLRACAAAALWVAAAAGMAAAQSVPDIGFRSVGRGAPVQADVRQMPITGPAWRRDGPDQPQYVYGHLPDALPANIQPLPVDIFTTSDFYADRALWTDPRYFRCNSSYNAEEQWGMLVGNPLITTDNPAHAPWGHCDHDYPREAIISPYGFDSAQAHYEALLEETHGRGGPHQYSFADFPAAEWNGVYERTLFAQDQQSWYWMRHAQIPTILSLLTPEYQERFVQETYHHTQTNAPLWPSTFCWPEGFMRRYHMSSVWEHYVIATPDLVQVMAGVARNFITNIHVGRSFNMDDIAAGGVPRLGAAVPRWYGETIGFWDGDTLITWTSNIQGWKAHSAFEFSNRMQSIEIYTPVRDADGVFTGLNHETILYDDEALAEPVRIVRTLNKINNHSDADQTPYAFIECVPTIFPIEGRHAPVSPGDIIEYEVPDMYGRPWAHWWRKHFEQHMEKTDTSEDMFSFE